LSDWIGTSHPVTSSAPPWPRDWRIWWDPRAPHDKGTPAIPPTIDPISPTTPEVPPTITGTGCPNGQIQLELEPGGYDVWFMAGADGNWTWTPVRPLPPGNYCARVRQRCLEEDGNSSAWSDWTEPECFLVGEGGPEPGVPPQTIDFEAKNLRYDAPTAFSVRGTLAYNIDGVWTYGVLRRVDDPYSRARASQAQSSTGTSRKVT
jgi:hypothetical protein